MYVNAKGEICSHSPKFTFCAPKPLEDLVTLEEESHGEEGGTDMLLVVPRAELLQVSRTQKGLVKVGKEEAEFLLVGKSDSPFLPAAICLFKESTARMPARARRVAAGT